MTIEHAFEVLRDQIELEINQILGARRVEIRSCLGVRDNPNRETFLRHFGDREANSVDGNRTFVSDIMRKPGG